MKPGLHIVLLYLFTFWGLCPAHAQKAANLVYNGDMELAPDTIYDPPYLNDPPILNTRLRWGLRYDTIFNYNYYKPPYWLRLIEPECWGSAGLFFACDSVRAQYNPTLEKRVLMLFTGRWIYGWGGFYGPSGTHTPWRGAKAGFRLTDTIQAGEPIYIEWMDFFGDNHELWTPATASCWFKDSIPDSVQVGLGMSQLVQGQVISTTTAGYRQWVKHRLLLQSPVQANSISLGNQGAANILTPYLPFLREVFSAYNFYDNLRLFRVQGTSRRDTLLCGPGPFILTGKTGKEWEWNDSATTQNFSINLGDSGWYVCKTFTDGYVNIDSIYVSFSAALSLQPAQDTVGCTGQTVTLASPRSTGFIYQWSDNSSGSNINTTNPGTYWVQSKKGSCTIVDTFHVQFAPKPVVYIGADTAFCGSFVHLLNAGPNRKEYTWNTGAKTSTLNVNTPGQYSVTVKDSLNCPNADTIQLEQITLNPIIISEDTITCKYVTLTGSPQQNNVSYKWSTGQTGISIQVTQTGSYTLTATHPFCTMSKTTTVTQLPKGPDVNLGPDTTLCGYNSIVLQNKKSNLPNYTYHWNTGESTPQLITNDSGQYILTIYRNQCVNSDTIEVAPNCEGTYYVPTAFSPNGDGLNEVFKVVGANIQHISMRIYNRWGEEVFSGDGKEVSWDGTFKGVLCTDAVYAYSIVVTAKNKTGLRHQLSGTITLMR